MSRKVSLRLGLLETLLTLLRHKGTAVWAARELGPNQPSITKRLGVRDGGFSRASLSDVRRFGQSGRLLGMIVVARAIAE
jgi:hypothetical protein